MAEREPGNDSKSRIDGRRLSGDVATATESDPDSGASSTASGISGLVRLRTQIYVSSAGHGGRTEGAGRICTAGGHRRSEPAYRQHGAASTQPQSLDSGDRSFRTGQKRKERG